MKVTAERRALEREYQQAIRATEAADAKRLRIWNQYTLACAKYQEAIAAERAAWNKGPGNEGVGVRPAIKIALQRQMEEATVRLATALREAGR